MRSTFPDLPCIRSAYRHTGGARPRGAHVMTGGSCFVTRARRRGDEHVGKSLSKTTGGFTSTSRWRENCQTSSCHRSAAPGGRGASGGDRGGGGGSALRNPRATPPHLARRGEIATKTQELRPISNCATLPNHVLPLARFGASAPAYVTAARHETAAWCGPITT
jgi:hypothetical protein